MHFHDTRGTGQANALAAVQAGVTQLDASIGGLGGCPFAPGASGNIATEELVYMLEESGVRTGLDLDAVLAAARVTEQAVGHELPSSLYRAGGRSVPRSAADAARDASPRTSPRIVDPRLMRDVLGHFASGRHRGHRDDRRRPDRVHLPVVQLAVARPAAGGLRPGPHAPAPGRGCATIGRFCVNVLAEGQDAVSQNFARSGADKFAGVPLAPERARRPRCSTASSPGSTASCGPSTTAATTRIVVARVLDLGADPDRRPLLFHRGRLRPAAGPGG